jgi:hypothetical protein
MQLIYSLLLARLQVPCILNTVPGSLLAVRVISLDQRDEIPYLQTAELML